MLTLYIPLYHLNMFRPTRTSLQFMECLFQTFPFNSSSISQFILCTLSFKVYHEWSHGIR